MAATEDVIADVSTPPANGQADLQLADTGNVWVVHVIPSSDTDAVLPP
jgi:hypothetical protein